MTIAPRQRPDQHPPAVGSTRLLPVIRGVHSAVFLVELGAIGWLVASGILGRRDRSVLIAAALVAVEAAVFAANSGVCPLTPLAERNGAASGGVSDIYLPDALARTIPWWSSALIAVAACLHVRAWRRRAGNGVPDR